MDWCWSWNSSTLATWCRELTHLKRPWRWERLRAEGEGDDRGWDGWMASPTQWTWVWVNSGRWWWTGRPGVLRFMGSQRVRHDWATELNGTENKRGHCCFSSAHGAHVTAGTYPGYTGMLSHLPSLCHGCLVAKSCLTLLWPRGMEAPPSMGFSRQEYLSGLPCPPPGESSWPRVWTHISCIGS